MKENRSNMPYTGGLTHCVNRLLPSNFEIVQLPGTRLRLVVFLLRKPHFILPIFTHYGGQFNIGKLYLLKRTAKRFPLDKANFERKAPQLQANCQSLKSIELFITQIVPR